MQNEVDLILFNGVIHTIDEKNSIVDAVAVKDSKISAVGTNEEIKRLKTEKTKLFDLEGKTVLPGFIDTHTHLMFTGKSLMGIDLTSAKSIQDIKDLLKEKAKDTPKGDWIFGFFMNEFELEEKREPYKEELDEVTSDHYVVLYHTSLHCVSANTRAFEFLNLSPNIDGIDKYKDSTPTGVIRDPAITEVHKKLVDIVDEQKKIQALKIASEHALKKGITTVHALEDGDLAPGEAKFVMDHQNNVKLRIIIFPQIMNVKEVQELGLPRIGGCILADGALENHTAALFEPYSDTIDDRGTLYYSKDIMERFILEAHKAGLQIAFHAIGERAIDQILTAYEKALQKYPREDHRHRIEHFEFPTWNQIDRAAKAKVILTMNPGFIVHSYGPDMKLMTKLLGKTRIKRFHPYKQVLDANILVSGGSDSPCSPMDPLGGICYLVIHPIKDNRINVLDAVKMFTINAAKTAFEEKEKGSIEVGKLADFVVLDKDPFKIKPEEIINVQVLATIVGGEIVYSKG
ncbi:MAG TPA: amidohydrolase [Thermoplasmatales archaeon]|nr:amidohydrolase [Thermoplasmatales archaeon]